MSAWAEILYADNSDEWREMCGKALAEVRADHARELTAKQRAYDGPSVTMAGNCMVPLDMITALIDPEVSEE